MNGIRRTLPLFVHTYGVFPLVNSVKTPIPTPHNEIASDALFVEYVPPSAHGSRWSDWMSLTEKRLETGAMEEAVARTTFYQTLFHLASAWSVAFSHMGFVSHDAHIDNILLHDTGRDAAAIVYTPHRLPRFEEDKTVSGSRGIYVVPDTEQSEPLEASWTIPSHDVLPRHIDYGKASTWNTNQFKGDVFRHHWFHDWFLFFGHVCMLAGTLLHIRVWCQALVERLQSIGGWMKLVGDELSEIIAQSAALRDQPLSKLNEFRGKVVRSGQLHYSGARFQSCANVAAFRTLPIHGLDLFRQLAATKRDDAMQLFLDTYLDA
jgi:hypothetical protein